MKRRPCDESKGVETTEEEARSAKKLREEAAEGSAPVPVPVPVPELGEDAIYEVLRRADARTLAAAACVSRRWRRLAADERLWEAACVRHWEAARDYGGARLRPSSSPSAASAASTPSTSPPPPPPPPPPIAASSSSPSPIAASSPSPSPIAAWPMEAAPAPARRGRRRRRGEEVGRDEVQLSLSLLSIGFFERMSAGEYKGGGGGGGGGEGDGRG
uniref:F-box domain-containing protein n=1 Tax=Ananas comosus var. bracteatus TaxID=296719 RepID=A0A6V7NX26_ANACO|nr:unnamed protein product [Ananas comosus var. bracteatus]